MIKTNNKRMSTETLVLAAVMTSLVIILQFMGAFVRLGPFQCSLVLMPIVVGAALCGPKISAWLGFVFGMVVLLNGDATAFLTVNAMGTVITVLAKGTLCGLCAGLVYNLLEKKNVYHNSDNSAKIAVGGTDFSVGIIFAVFDIQLCKEFYQKNSLPII